MKTILKRFVSLILVWMMILSISPVAMAAQSDINFGASVSTSEEVMTVTIFGDNEASFKQLKESSKYFSFTVDCSFPSAYTVHEGVLVDSSLTDQNVTFSVADSGDYKVINGVAPVVASEAETITVTVSQQNDTYLDSITVPCSWSNPVVTLEAATVSAAVADGMITIPLDAAGTYLISQDSGAGNTGSGGTSEDGLSWTYDETTGLLAISGNGPMADYTTGTAPWKNWRSQITGVVIKHGITRVGNMAFAGCSTLSNITFEGSAPIFAEEAFKGVTATMYYPVKDSTWTTHVMQDYGGSAVWVPYSMVENRVTLDTKDLTGQTSVWVDGVEYALQTAGNSSYVDLPDGDATSLIAYTYHTGASSDPHVQYPVGMKVWMLGKENGFYTATRVEALDNILQYSGTSIRVTGKQGIRMITSIEKGKKRDLIADGLAGYTLKEYGTVISWASKLEGDNPLVLGQSYTMSNYAYRKGIADPIFAYDGDLMQYTNVLVGFSLDQCENDIAMRPYMILTDAEGKEITLYGGIVQRSIGYIAAQNANTFDPITQASAYSYVWDIITHVYGEDYIPEAA